MQTTPKGQGFVDGFQLGEGRRWRQVSAAKKPVSLREIPRADCSETMGVALLLL